MKFCLTPDVSPTTVRQMEERELRVREDDPVDGLSVFAGLRPARITQAALEPPAADEWVDVPALEPMEVVP
jgi:hypothetical protein